MKNSFIWVANAADKPIYSDSLAIIISLLALAVSILSWFIVHVLAIRAADVDRKNNFQLNIYQKLLDRSNELLKIISDYSASAVSHTNTMARVLNDYHAYDNLPDTKASIDAKYNLRVEWLDASKELGELSFKMQKTVEDYMRYLDMNGTDFTRGTVIYDALLKVKIDAYKAASRNRKRWSDHDLMDELTVESFDEMSKETQADSNIVFDFGLCIDDVLIAVYNQSIAKVLDKPLKEVEIKGRRRVITEKGLLDNRKSNHRKSKKVI